ncbi:hypothetical protein GE061_017749 [Apolygus lucorum]|uniref:Corticotropin-releasing factor binding protein C-terminal domain-containing protein n=1 Tax=Apolygus lucorum TaxID=248454 RepID=A0A8S9XEK0_APOLU|nr:hypothetical protein GE061_017749 [Apolygus lucorum]
MSTSCFSESCHVLVEDNMQSVYTLRNYGRNANCSLTALFPVSVSLLSLSVGITMTGSNFKVETGTMKKCQETGHKDYLEISGGIDFAVPKVLAGANLCGLDSYPGQISETVLCGVSSVTLYSSGDCPPLPLSEFFRSSTLRLITGSIVDTLHLLDLPKT